MGKFSYISIFFTVIACIFLLINIASETFNEAFAFSGISCLLTGTTFSFLTIYNQERNRINYIPPFLFFATLLWVTLFEPS